MTFQSIFFDQLWTQFKQTSLLEFTGVVFGIASVLFSRKENIWVFPTGLISTTVFIYIYLQCGLYADASVNLYYTIMSILGWAMWAKKSEGQTILHISYNSIKEQLYSVGFFAACWAVLYFILIKYTPSTVPVADSFTSAAAFTGMYLMNKKKVENWWWWIITDIASIPLNAYKGLMFASFQYLVFTILAIMGWISWHQKYKLLKNG